MATNFELAPEAKVVDGLFAVCVDIQTITGTIRFDASSRQAEADISIDFTMDDQAGCPVFDLRQQIAEAWLDGSPLAPAELAHHDFGGGSNADLRIVNSVLSAGSQHTLRLRYMLGTPQASSAGSYQPGLSWDTGPRLALNFGFTDLGAGRYLESWVPANLIFDQFAVDLSFIVENTGIAHEIITNGQVTNIAANHWRVQWPDSTTALSTLLEIRAADTVEHEMDTVVLPVSGAAITIDAWRLSSLAIDLSDQIDLIKGFLSDNENDVGAYWHGDRFVAMFVTGGMEYDGGTTTSSGPLRHETFHSWWGRGVKPASQNDGWWDEAWTVYNDHGGNGSTPFDFSRPPATLCSLNAWNRVTPGASYSAGERVFDGLAALQNAAILRSSMNDFYVRNRAKPTTTQALESHLLCELGKKEVVDGFHRFVYGFGDSVEEPDLWLRDHELHGGEDDWDGAFWNSPDIWVRNSDDDGTEHQNPEFGQDNWFYARVRNRGTQTADHFAVTFTAQSYAGMQFSFPDDFLPCTVASVDFDLDAGDTRVVKARWPRALVPPVGTHSCLLASVLTRRDDPASGHHVWEHNNLAQKNLTIVDLAPNSWIVVPFLVRNLERWLFPWYSLRLSRFEPDVAADVELLHPKLDRLSGFSFETPLHHFRDDAKSQAAPGRLLDCGVEHDPEVQVNHLPWTSENPRAAISRVFAESPGASFRSKPISSQRLTLPKGEPYFFGLRIHVPGAAKPGSTLRFHLSQRLWPCWRSTGGISVVVRVKHPKPRAC